MLLHQMHYAPKSRNHKSKVKGRGYSSGMGKRSTRGNKGQKARKSGNVRIGFEGGQTPIYRRLPKVGFTNAVFRQRWVIISLDKLSKIPEKTIDRAVLIKHNFLRQNDKLPIKIIGRCQLKQPIDVSVEAISVGAKESIVAVGGNVALVNRVLNENEK